MTTSASRRSLFSDITARFLVPVLGVLFGLVILLVVIGLGLMLYHLLFNFDGVASTVTKISNY